MFIHGRGEGGGTELWWLIVAGDSDNWHEFQISAENLSGKELVE